MFAEHPLWYFTTLAQFYYTRLPQSKHSTGSSFATRTTLVISRLAKYVIWYYVTVSNSSPVLSEQRLGGLGRFI